jgi:hypothetical protein
MPQDHKIRFGIEVAGLRSSVWCVRAGAWESELFIERERPDKVHASLHQSGQWHVKVKRRKVVQWPRPGEFWPGYTRAVMVAQPAAVAVHTEAAPAGSVIVPLHVDPTQPAPVMFNIFIEDPGANPASWPGRSSMGTKLVGRIPLAAGAGACVVTHHVEALQGNPAVTLAPDEAARAAMRRLAAAGTLHGTMLLTLTDGTFAFIDGKFPPLEEAH